MRRHRDGRLLRIGFRSCGPGERKQLTVAAGEYQQGRLLDEYRVTWTEALISRGQQDLAESPERVGGVPPAVSIWPR